MIGPCQICSREVPLKYVRLYRNIGLVFLRFWSTTEGPMCRSCAWDKWLQEMILTLALGWWGVISFFTNVFAVFSNLGQLPTILSIPAEPTGMNRASVPGTGKALAGISAACLAGLLAIAGLYTSKVLAPGRRIAEIRKQLETTRTHVNLTKEVACQLVEVFRFEEGWRLPQPQCQTLLSHSEDNAELLILEAGEEKHFCLRRGTRWFVSAETHCAKGPLPPANPALSIESQETAWRKNELSMLSTEVSQKFITKINSLSKAISEAKEIPTCSAELLSGIAPPVPWDFKTVDQRLIPQFVANSHKRRDTQKESSLLDGTALAFLTSHGFGAALSGRELDHFDVETIEKTRLIGIVAAWRVHTPPKVVDLNNFEGGAFAGGMYLADLESDKVLCLQSLSFRSSPSLSNRSENAQNAVDLDFQRAFSSAKMKWVSNEFSFDQPADEIQQPSHAQTGMTD